MSDSEIKLSRAAADQFAHKQFTQCAKTTQKILTLSKGKSAAPVILRHNFAVATFCANNGTDPEKLLASLKKIAPSWDHQKDKYSEERCVLVYNIALLEFGLKRYRTALTHLEPVFPCLADLSDYLAMKVCFLLLDIYLVLGKQHCSVVQNAAQVLSFLQAFANQTKKPTPSKGNKAPPAPTDSVSPQIDPLEFKYHFHLYKAKFNLFNRVLNQATREIKCCMGVSNSGAHPMFLKSNLENLKENYDKSVKILNAMQDDKSDPTLPALYFNNIGIIHFQLKKYEAAAYYFARSMKENESIYGSGSQRQVSLRTFARDRRPEILYNAGLLYLLSGKPRVAFDCFQGSALTYYKDPRLWLRMAECCVAVHAQVTAEARDEDRHVTPVHIPSSVIPSADVVTTKLVLHMDPESALDLSEERDDPLLESVFRGGPFGTLSLDYATTCLRSCLYLCRQLLSKFPPTDASKEAEEAPTLNLQVTKDDLDTIRQACLTNLAYVSLCTNNPKVAIVCANNLLLSKGGDHAYGLFAHFYVAEAYCILNRPADALKHLPIQEEFPTDLNSPYFHQPYSASVRYSLLHNMVVTQILMGDYEMAQQCLAKALASCPPECLSFAIMLQVYLELRGGNTRMAIELLRKGRPSPSTRIIGKRQDV